MNMLKFEDIENRNSKYLQKRYGISIVYGLNIPDNLLAYIFEIQNACNELFLNCFDWYETKRIHSTLIRCKSSFNPILYKKFENHRFLSKLKAIPKFEMSTENLTIATDGAIRLFLSSKELPLPVGDEEIYKLENDLKINLRLIEKPWLTLANMKPNQLLVEHVNNNLTNFSSEFINQQLIIPVDCLKAIYFEDTGYQKTKILNEIKLL